MAYLRSYAVGDMLCINRLGELVFLAYIVLIKLLAHIYSSSVTENKSFEERV